jgi:hypothetical protein
MIALDATVLAHAVNRFVPGHPRAARLLEELVNGDRAWALPWPAVHEFLRLVSHPHVVARPLGARDALAFADEVLASASVHLLAAGAGHRDALEELLGAIGTSGEVPPGLETAALLREHGIRELLSTDRGMRRYAFLTVIDSVHGPLWSPTSPPARRYRVLGGRGA